jgi:hypothetical protein
MLTMQDYLKTCRTYLERQKAGGWDWQADLDLWHEMGGMWAEIAGVLDREFGSRENYKR